MNYLFWDSETRLIAPGLTAPPMACMSACQNGEDAYLLHWTEAGAHLEQKLKDPAMSFVGANLPFDWAVAAANFPLLLPLIFKAYDEDRCFDVLIRQKLIDIAGGSYRGFLNSKWVWVPFQYNLDAVTKRHSAMRLNKDDAVRLTYGDLRHLPLSAWPDSHIKYATEDALATRECFLGQERVLAKNPHVNILVDQHHQGRADFALRLMSIWGLRTEESAVDTLEAMTNEKYLKIQEQLIEASLVRPNGTRDTKAAKARMLDVMGYKREGTKIVPLDVAMVNEYTGQPLPRRKMHLTDGGKKEIPDVSLSADACKDSEDPTLILYGQFGELKSVLSKDVKALRGGVFFPLHTRFDIAASLRSTSSNPNVQNWRRLPGIREAFRPRFGRIYAQADVEGLELCTLAQTCYDLFGYSKLGDAINAGIDVHSDFAAAQLGITYEEGKRRKKLGDTPHVVLIAAVGNKLNRKPLRHEVSCTDAQWQDYVWYTDFVDSRQTAKVANFGFPGGLGVKHMVEFAKATYGVILTEGKCAELKERWLNKWPEMADYFAYIGSLMSNEDGTGDVVQPRTGSIRGGASYCAAANTFFQRLGAIATKAAAYALAKECYIDTSSVMYGTRPVNYIHDEFIAETDDNDRAHDVAVGLERIMVTTIQPWIPNVRVSAPPLLMRYWSKDAKAVYNDQKRLIPWGK